MKELKLLGRLVASVLLIGMLAACSKTEEAPAAGAPAEAAPDPAAAAAAATATPAPQPAAPSGAEVLPGSSRVRSAMAAKDYETAVGALLALRGAATRSPQTEEFMTLYDEVKFGLMDASTTEPKAAQALAMLRAASAGR